MSGYEKMDEVRDQFASDGALLDEILTAMSEKEAEEMAEWVARMYDLPVTFDY